MSFWAWYGETRAYEETSAVILAQGAAGGAADREPWDQTPQKDKPQRGAGTVLNAGCHACVLLQACRLSKVCCRVGKPGWLDAPARDQAFEGRHACTQMQAWHPAR